MISTDGRYATFFNLRGSSSLLSESGEFSWSIRTAASEADELCFEKVRPFPSTLSFVFFEAASVDESLSLETDETSSGWEGLSKGISSGINRRQNIPLATSLVIKATVDKS